MIEEELLKRTGRLINLGDLELMSRPLTDEQETELDAFVRSTHIRQTAEASTELPLVLAKMCIEAAVKQSNLMCFDTDEGAALFSTPAGMARLVQVMCSESHPNITVKDIQDRLKIKPELMQDAYRLFQIQNPHLVNAEEDNESTDDADEIGDAEQAA